MARRRRAPKWEGWGRTVQLRVVVHGGVDPDEDRVVHRAQPSDAGSRSRGACGEAGCTHQWVMTMLCLPLRMSWRPWAPAIFASRDCAKVRVTCGRVGGGGREWWRRVAARNVDGVESAMTHLGALDGEWARLRFRTVRKSVCLFPQ